MSIINFYYLFEILGLVNAFTRSQATQTVKDYQLNHSYPSQNIKQWFVAGKVDEQMYNKLPPNQKHTGCSLNIVLFIFQEFSIFCDLSLARTGLLLVKQKMVSQ